MNWSFSVQAARGIVLAITTGLVGCVQTIDRPPVRLPQYAAPLTAPTPQRVVRAADAIDETARSLASELMSDAAPRIGNRRIAVLPIRDDWGQARSIAATATDAFRVEVFRSGPYHFVADNDMKRALAELRLEDGLRKFNELDSRVRSNLGKLLSADLIIDSRITDSVTDLRFTSEMIEIATGRLVGIAQELLPKSALTGSGVSFRPTSGAGSTLHYGTDWLHTRLEAVSMNGDRTVKAVFAFTNRGQDAVRLWLKEPELRAYMVDPAGTAFAFAGADGLDQQRSVTIRPATRHEVTLYFGAPVTAVGLLTMRTSWATRGTAKREQDFVVPDLALR